MIGKQSHQWQWGVRVLGIFVLLWWVTGTRSPGGRLVQPPCHPQVRVLNPGEVVRYKIYYRWGFLWLAAGEVEITTQLTSYEGKPAYYFRGYGKTYKSYEWFYKVEDLYESWADTMYLRPFRFRRDVYEGGYTIFEDVRFDHQQRVAYSLKDEQTIPKKFPIKPCVFDVVTAIFYVRTLDFSGMRPGDFFKITTFIDENMYELKVTYLGKQILKTRHGTFRCIVIEPELIPGTIFKEGAKMQVWATDDSARIVLLATSPIIVGEIRAELLSWKNSRYPVRAYVSRSQ